MDDVRPAIIAANRLALSRCDAAPCVAFHEQKDSRAFLALIFRRTSCRALQLPLMLG